MERVSAMRRDEIDRLPVKERLRLIEELWESIDANPEDVPVTSAQRAELDRRIAAHEADPEAAVDAKDAIARLRRKR